MWNIQDYAMPDNHDPREQPVAWREPEPQTPESRAQSRAKQLMERAVAYDAMYGPLRRLDAREAVRRLVQQHGALAILDILRDISGEQP